MAKVIIVDDSSTDRTLLKKKLETNNHTVFTASKNGRNLLDLYKKLKPDVIFLDVILQNNNGLKLLEQVLDYDKNANVIVYSSVVKQNLNIEAYQLGAKYFLIKPFIYDILNVIIKKILETQRSV